VFPARYRCRFGYVYIGAVDKVFNLHTVFKICSNYDINLQAGAVIIHIESTSEKGWKSLNTSATPTATSDPGDHYAAKE
jgi:hypothetical protein